ncbi:glycosyltransferase [Zobellia galactanivorans]|uniref:Glycosyltransferase, family GT4 n=1 Tax=Zobellia galactanivorans (strain DSM 12802 / CCUG 47099 / CIP 106680 / NCIMB 13871 / Dsij) TaxID=63186 RepID=G0L3L2_ZOBGA|nr:glycosyltransferase [Zobellia galactanivorans]MBU3024835.1 glycosyltransferase [Zobellia galactanivorans]CAZ98491.1 Glycosyltransferase, family GT4 [Zobellia galactanivorans]
MEKRNIYATYDVFPSAKGASTHIREMILVSSGQCDQLQLFCLRGNSSYPAVQTEGNIFIKRYYNEEKLNYLEKASLFSQQLFIDIQKHKESIQIGHFRDVWSGMGLIAEPSIKTIFEVNALTSVELPYRYPDLTPSFLRKLKELELQCLHKSTVIITPSEVTKTYLETNFSVDADKIKVIPNGAHIPDSFERPIDAPDQYLIYFGAIQPWQGLEVLLKAMTYLEDFKDLKLVICLAVKEKAFKPYRKLLEKLGLENRVILKSRLPKKELYNYIHYAEASIAPLKACDRNITQGCCPLKILESMACKTMVIASELPVVSELVTEEEALLFEPDREQDLARCIRFILDEPERKESYIASAFKKVQGDFLWEDQKAKLKKVYQDLML